MLHRHNPAPYATSQDREARLRALLDQLRPAAEDARRRMAETLVDAPDQQLFRDVELRLRAQAHARAAAAQQTGLEGRKKGGITAPASSAPTA